MNEMKEKDKNFFIYCDDVTPSYLEKSKSLQAMTFEEEFPTKS